MGAGPQLGQVEWRMLSLIPEDAVEGGVIVYLVNVILAFLGYFSFNFVDFLKDLILLVKETRCFLSIFFHCS